MKYKPKSFVVPTIYLLILFIITTGVYFTKKVYDKKEESDTYDNITFVSNSIFNRSVPIISIPDVVRNPFEVDDIKIARYYYNKNDDIERKQQSIVFYENTYMPNTGIDYSYDNVFDVVAVYDGTVVDVMEDELLGKTIKIRHNGEVISVYQGLGQVDVNTGDVVFSGQRIGVSGTNKISKDLGNILHFEMYKNGETIDPLTCINKKLGDI